MSDRGETIDVNRLVEELRGRVAARRVEGAYPDDLATLSLDFPDPEPRVRVRTELAYSTRTGIGRPLTLLKRALMRLMIHVFDDFGRQVNRAVHGTRLWAEEALDAEARAREANSQLIAETRRWAEEAFDAEAGARGAQLARVEALENELRRLQLEPRLGRLERDRRAVPRPSTPAADGSPASSAPAAPVDYFAFEARFRGEEGAIRARQETYREALADRRRVVDLGCGRGELIELLAEAGVEAYGVELDPDFLALLKEKGVEAVAQDALAHLAGLEEGAVDAVVASHVVEHLPPAVATRLIEEAWRVLPEGGLLILETPNPESLVAGSINFHRDPTHLRPVHPDTLAFICESTGFDTVEVRRLSPVPDEHRLPSRAPGEGELSEHLDRVVARLNDLLYGFQDYAVVARR